MNSVTRALRRFVSKLTGKNKVIYFVVLFLICVVAICIAIYVQYFYKYYDTDPLMLGIHIGAKKTNEEYASLKNNFNTLFTNDVRVNSENLKVDKINTSQNVVYTYNKVQNQDENYYDVDVKIPAINVNNEVAKRINSEIIEKFDKTAKDIMTKAEGYTIYKVDYAAFVNNGVISVAIKERSKIGSKAETVKVTTYNYSIPNKSEISLTDLIKLKETSKEAVQEAITTTIEVQAEKNNDVAKEYGGLVRNPEDKMYLVENSKNYFLTDDGYVYIVYDYAEKNTNEIDIVIF
ncbi:MAG: hypothetical protein IJ867_00075 [Clostridia bacterium]|nr:hypothetical protein [Clostridia bacterium]